MTFEELPLLDDYEIIKKRFFFVKEYIDSDTPETITAFMKFRDDFSQYFHMSKTKALICVLDYFDEEFFLLMPVYNTYLRMLEIMPIETHLSMFMQESENFYGKKKFKKLTNYKLIHEFLNFIANLK